MFKDSVFENLYRLFSQAISKKRLIGPKGKSATDYLNQLLPLVKDTLTKEDLQDQLMGALINEAQTSVNRYTRPPVLDTTDLLNFTVFNTGSLLLNEALKYAANNKTLAKEINARKLVLEARALAEIGGNTSVALSKIDSSLSLMTTSYAYHTKGLLLAGIDKYDEAFKYFEKATGQNKKWAYPVVAEGDLFRSRGKYDSAIVYYRRALHINPSNDNNVLKMGIALQENGQYDSSIVYFQKALTIRNKALGEENFNSANCLNYLAKSYEKKGDNSKAENLYTKAIGIFKKMPEPEHVYYANALNNLAGLYEKTGKRAAARPLYTQASVIKQNIAIKAVNAGQRHPPEVIHPGQVIPPDQIRDLLKAVESGRKEAGEFAHYLCKGAGTTVQFNEKRLSFEAMCNELREIQQTTKHNPQIKLRTDPKTNCIIWMQVDVAMKEQGKNAAEPSQPEVKKPDRVFTEAEISDLRKDVQSGKRDISEFAGYLCQGAGITVEFKEKKMAFETMCTEVNEIKKTTKRNPQIKLRTDPKTNCIIWMQVDVAMKETGKNAAEPSQPEIKKHDQVFTQNEINDLTKDVQSGKRDIFVFAGYLCQATGTLVKFNEKTMTFERMCTELKQAKKTTEINNPEVELIKDPKTNCITSMHVTVTRKRVIKK